MSTQTLIKQPSESRLYSMEFAPNLAPGETISSVTSVTADPSTGIDITAVPVASGTQAQQRIAGGTDGVQYKITFVVETSAGNTLEGEGYLTVRQL